MFELATTQVKLANVNPRAELHGEDPKPAFDLKIEATLPNSVLYQFNPELVGLLYKKDENPDLVDQVSESDAFTALRFPKMGAIKWDWEGTGYDVTVGYGIGGASDIHLGDCKVDHFKFEPMNGGSVLITFRVIAHPETADVGKLCEFIQQNIEITVMPPEPATLGELFAGGEQEKPVEAAPAKKSKKQKQADALAEAQAQFEATGDQDVNPAAALLDTIKTKKTVLAPAASWPFPT